MKRVFLQSLNDSSVDMDFEEVDAPDGDLAKEVNSEVSCQNNWSQILKCKWQMNFKMYVYRV